MTIYKCAICEVTVVLLGNMKIRVFEAEVSNGWQERKIYLTTFLWLFVLGECLLLK